MRSPLARPVLAAALALLAGCATVPGTGRSQFRFIPLETEMSLGEEGYVSELQDAKLITSGADYEMVQRVGKRIAAAATELYPEPSAEFEWEVKLIDDPKTVNAWCMPGGKIAVYTGILPVTEDETGLAVVLGHEIGHAIARHGTERMSQGLLAQGLGTALSVAVAKEPATTQQLWMTAFGVGAEVGVLLPYSRTQESEADHLGLIFMAMAGYDPNTAVPFWERMASQAGNGKPPEFLSDHPADQTRINDIKKEMPEAMKYYKPQNASNP